MKKYLILRLCTQKLWHRKCLTICGPSGYYTAERVNASLLHTLLWPQGVMSFQKSYWNLLDSLHWLRNHSVLEKSNLGHKSLEILQSTNCGPLGYCNSCRKNKCFSSTYRSLPSRHNVLSKNLLKSIKSSFLVKK